MSSEQRDRMLISVDDLADTLGAPQLRVFDAAVFLHPSGNGYRAEKGHDRYLQGHIPGAAYLDLVAGLADTDSGLGFTLPQPDALAAGIGAHGIDNASDVVLYSSGHIMWATRAWWLLHYAGHDRVRLLDGGLQAWSAADQPLATDDTRYPPAGFDATPRATRFADLAEVESAQGAPGVCTVNALSAALYEGTGEFHYGRRGHIPGSRHLAYDDVLQDGRFAPDAPLREALNRAGMLEAERVITYCGGGIAATVHAFACLLAGAADVAVYDGSMSEWVREGKPLSTGTAP